MGEGALSSHREEMTGMNDKTIVELYWQRDEEAIRELARLLGGAEITEAVLNNAAEMKKLAEQTKQG